MFWPRSYFSYHAVQRWVYAVRTRRQMALFESNFNMFKWGLTAVSACLCHIASLLDKLFLVFPKSKRADRDEMARVKQLRPST